MRRLQAALAAICFLAVAPSLGAQAPVMPGGAAPAPAPVGVAVEARLARELHLAVGDTFRLGPSPDSLRALARVEAIYEPAPDPATVLRDERRIRLHLPDLAALLGQRDRVDRFGVVLQPGANPDSAAARLNGVAFGYRAYPSAEIAAGSSRTFQVVSRFHKAIALITIAASAVFLLCIMLLKVEERRLDAAVMRFVGVRRRTIVGALVLEAAAIALVGAVLGIGFAYTASWLVNAYYQRRFATALVFSHVTPDIVLFGTMLSVVLGVGAGALAALRLARTRPMALWGRE